MRVIPRLTKIFARTIDQTTSIGRAPKNARNEKTMLSIGMAASLRPLSC